MVRKPGTRTDGSPFDPVMIDTMWRKATEECGFVFFRRDVCGATIERGRYGREEQWGWEIDHIRPVALGGTDEVDNLQPLQWENNRHKGDHYPDWTAKIRS